MSAQPPQPPRGPVQGQPQFNSDQEIDKFLESLLGGDLPGEGFLFPDGKQEPRTVPDIEEVRNEALRAIKNMAIALQLPYGEDKKADVGRALLACAQSYLLLDPGLDAEGVSVEGRAEAEAKAAQKFPPRVPPNAAEEALNAKTKPQQEALKHDRGQTPLPRPRATG